MALIQANFMSKKLLRMATVHVILPVDKFPIPGVPEVPGKDGPFKTLYLLHGIFGNYTDWISGTRIQRLAEKKNLAVGMPSGDNSFYIDRPASCNNYGEFIGDELVEMTRKMFPLSHDREDTYIGGLSTGGFGAIRNGLKYNETFSRIAALSAAVHVLEDIENANKGIIDLEDCGFGNLKEAVLSDKNPKVIVRALKEKIKSGENAPLPKIYLACGTDDFLIDANRNYRDFFRESGMDLTYFEEPGFHDWDFWDKHIQKVIEWLPLDEH